MTNQLLGGEAVTEITGGSIVASPSNCGLEGDKVTGFGFALKLSNETPKTIEAKLRKTGSENSNKAFFSTMKKR